MTWEHGDCLLMNPADRIFNLVIDKRVLDCVMCSSDQIKRKINMYRDKARRFLRMRDLKDEDNDSDNNEVGVEKGGTTMTPSTTKNATRKGKKKLGDDHSGEEKQEEE